MKLFHISDVLTVTTGRLVSARHMDGVYEILNFLTGDNLFTHQIPRASREAEPWMRAQFPQLFPDVPVMAVLIEGLDRNLAEASDKALAVSTWVDVVRQTHGLPEMVPVYEMGADMHTRIDPLEELRAMVGDSKVISVSTEGDAA